uniref:Uncharacterized protein n=1 Tax=Avena sativa TaxID=4498 RepID=A0ACD5XUD5_AVESA
MERHGAAGVAVRLRRRIRLCHGHRFRKLQLQRFLLFWSLGLACVDIFSIRNKKDLHYRALVTLIVLGDWILAVFVFSGVSASASVMILFARDINFCRVYWKLACGQFALSIVLASIVWLLDAASSFSVFWLLVSFY